MSTSPTVSIIVPVYNVEKYIVRCLRSVADQTYKGSMECILVDDCGNDQSIATAQEYIDGYDGSVDFRTVHHDHNQGLAAARNTGCASAKGEYVYFLDSDDAITPDCIESLMALATKHPDADFVQGNILGNDLTPSHYAFADTIPEYADEQDKIEELMLSEIITSACNRLIKSSVLRSNNLFFKPGIVHEDMNWVYFLSRHVRAAAFCTKGTYIYYTNDSSIMTSVSPQMRIRRYQSRIVSSKEYMADAADNGSTPHRRRYIGVNLLSCLTELVPLGSLRHWWTFWRYVTATGIRNIAKATPSRMLFLLMLLPPACFFAGKDKYRWRVQKDIVSKL